MRETNNPRNDFLNMQEDMQPMFGGFPFPAAVPEAVPTTPEPPVQQETKPPITTVTAPTQGSLFREAMAQTPAGQQTVVPLISQKAEPPSTATGTATDPCA